MKSSWSAHKKYSSYIVKKKKNNYYYWNTGERAGIIVCKTGYDLCELRKTSVPN